MSLALAAAASVVSQADAALNLVANGTFEDSLNTRPSNGSLPAGSTLISGWKVGADEIAWGLPNGEWSYVVPSHHSFLDLSGYHNSSPYGSVSQATPINTGLGQQYLVSFMLGGSSLENSHAPQVQVHAGSAFSSFTAPAATEWAQYSFTFTANSSSTGLQFTGLDPSLGGSQGFIGLADVSMTAVPEPDTLIAGALVLLPFTLNMVRSFRRKS